jgi:hypothetical protein
VTEAVEVGGTFVIGAAVARMILRVAITAIHRPCDGVAGVNGIQILISMAPLTHIYVVQSRRS